MAIDIYVGRESQDEAEKERQYAFAMPHLIGLRGHLQEPYHGGPYATQVLVPEAFEHGKAAIPASVLQERLPGALDVAKERARLLFGADEDALEIEIQEALESFIAFVHLCDRAEKRTGRPVTIIASY